MPVPPPAGPTLTRAAVARPPMPDDADAALEQARLLLTRGEFASAVDLLDRLVTGDDADPRRAPDSDAALALAARLRTRLRALCALVECRLARGELDEAAALLARLRPTGGAADAWVHHARAEVAAAHGEHESALLHHRAAGGAIAAFTSRPRTDTPADTYWDQVGWSALRWRPGAALALVHLGRPAEALDLAYAEQAEAWEAGDPLHLAVALRTLAAVEPFGERVLRLREARALLRDSDAARLQAQVATDLAAHLILSGEGAEALALLREAESYAMREQLWPLQNRIGRLLQHLGEDPRRREAEALAVLTQAERRVAVLVLEGRSNRDIAGVLLISVKAVEGHLSKIYRKLGVASRQAMLAAIAS
ncbi:LuxR C-terminal-related transcriptional regulator [Nocardioides sp.]|uniref:LuxR C-terminal-related transcriptional regulator n=1 Tax=Nocardioides sp. TaxID=35761 RepID=UPI003511D261